MEVSATVYGMAAPLQKVATDTDLQSPRRPTAVVEREEWLTPEPQTSRWAMLFYLSALAMLSDWLCFSAAPIATLVRRNLVLDDSHLVTTFLATNVVACLLEPAFVRRFGLRAAVVWGAAVMSVGCFLRACATELALSSLCRERVQALRVPAWIAIAGTMCVGAAQPLFQCTPSLLAANWFGENETTFAVTMALNANQLGIAGAYAVGAGLVHSDDELLRYFRALFVVSALLAVGAAVHFREKPPRPPSYSALQSLRRQAQTTERRNVFQHLKQSKDIIQDAMDSRGGSRSGSPASNADSSDRKRFVSPQGDDELEDGAGFNNNDDRLPQDDDRSSSSSSGQGDDYFYYYPDDDAVESKRDSSVDELPTVAVRRHSDKLSPREFPADSGDEFFPVSPEDDDAVTSSRRRFLSSCAGSSRRSSRRRRVFFHFGRPRHQTEGTGLLRRWLVISRRVGRGALDVTHDLYSSTKALMLMPGFVVCLVAFMASIVASNIFSTFLPHLIATAKLRTKERNATTNARVASLGALFQFFIMFGSLAFGALVDLTKQYKRALNFAFAGSVVALLCVADDRVNDYDLDAAVLLLGMFVGPVQPLAAELAVETTYPDGDENHIVAIQQTFGNCASALAVPAFHALSMYAKRHDLQRQYCLRLDYLALALLTLLAALFFRLSEGYHAPLNRVAANVGAAIKTAPLHNENNPLCPGGADDAAAKDRRSKYMTA